ncbi:MAG: tetratricopeptide repeat protein [Shimia sp.]|nr:tetratricopeptide repeat protein [Shimia sp.]
MQNTLPGIAEKLRSGHYNTAFKQARAGAKKNPKVAAFPKLAGIALFHQNKGREAVSYLTKALKLSSQDNEIKHYLAASLLAADLAQKAQLALQRWLLETPDDAELHYLLTACHMQLEDYAKAVESADSGLSKSPRLVKLQTMRGLAHFELQEHTAALADFTAASKAEPMNPEHWRNLGSVQSDQALPEEAMASFRRALDLAPEDFEARQNVAKLAAELGDFDVAIPELRKLLEIDPFCVISLARLLELETADKEEDIIKLARAALKSAALNDEDKSTVEVSLGARLLKHGDTKSALSHLAAANALRARIFPYYPEATAADLRKTQALFQAGVSRKVVQDETTPSPIFVIGQPRSGTTLTEMVLSAHSQVESLGELDGLTDIAINAISTGDWSSSDHRAEFLRAVPPLKPETLAFVDKTPQNFLFLGFLADAFPNARFIDVQRDPREVALSLWQKHLSGYLTFYSSRMDWMAHAANQYRQYMLHWETLFSDRIMSIRYENLVADLPKISREMADFCGLEWEETMLHPEKTTAAVRTSSLQQVRQQVHTSSLGKWRSYPGLFDEFQANLDPELWPELDL